MEGSVTETSLPRRTQLYCVGAAKSGTKSIADCFRKSLRAAHEPESERTIDLILSVASGALSPKELQELLRERDRRLWLEIDSSQLNYFVLGSLCALFPDARFVLTIRDPYSWLDSFVNHQLSRPVSSHWMRLRELRFRSHDLTHPIEEAALKRRGLYTLDGYLSYWAAHNQNVLSSVPVEKRLVVRTDEISRRVGEIARFAGVDANAADAGNAHANRAEKKHGVLGELDPDYLDAKVREHCGSWAREFFPEMAAFGAIRSVSPNC